jgi:predicted Rossmann-fold nucleotide-binding protein
MAVVFVVGDDVGAADGASMTLREIQDHDAFMAAVRAGTLADRVIQGVDVGHLDLADCDVHGAVFVGCTLSTALHVHLVERGALVFPRLPALPYEPARTRLYTVDELMTGYERGRHQSFFEASLDARIYARFVTHRHHPPFLEALAMRLHDLAVDDALEELLHECPEHPQRKVVAFMGGHAMKRTDPVFADVARCARALARAGYFIATGGGPGAMEAANLGAFAAGASDDVLAAMLRDLTAAASYKDEGWFDTAYAARARVAAPTENLGIPTWFYGHEPSNLFCTHVAKYFSNALREDGLLAVARHGVVFAPGGPGTMQEVFQDACQNAYGTMGDVSPMVFLGQRYWTVDRPALALMRSMTTGMQLAERFAAFDDSDAIVAFLKAHPPVPYRK